MAEINRTLQVLDVEHLNQKDVRTLFHPEFDETIEAIRLFQTRDGRKAFALVEFTDREAAEKAMELKNGMVYHYDEAPRRLHMEWAVRAGLSAQHRRLPAPGGNAGATPGTGTAPIAERSDGQRHVVKRHEKGHTRHRHRVPAPVADGAMEVDKPGRRQVLMDGPPPVPADAVDRPPAPLQPAPTRPIRTDTQPYRPPRSRDARPVRHAEPPPPTREPRPETRPPPPPSPRTTSPRARDPPAPPKPPSPVVSKVAMETDPPKPSLDDEPLRPFTPTAVQRSHVPEDRPLTTSERFDRRAASEERRERERTRRPKDSAPPPYEAPPDRRQQHQVSEAPKRPRPVWREEDARYEDTKRMRVNPTAYNDHREPAAPVWVGRRAQEEPRSETNADAHTQPPLPRPRPKRPPKPAPVPQPAYPYQPPAPKHSAKRMAQEAAVKAAKSKRPWLQHDDRFEPAPDAEVQVIEAAAPAPPRRQEEEGGADDSASRCSTCGETLSGSGSSYTSESGSSDEYSEVTDDAETASTTSTASASSSRSSSTSQTEPSPSAQLTIAGRRVRTPPPPPGYRAPKAGNQQQKKRPEKDRKKPAQRVR
eukprot:GGOE01041563.1.p1 GENE.GGOE01041563.1~~GGOE01041563.1.p1  ORF type:complete len:591 (-),score=59.27 GGOE01041563.1:412-2184(-)